MADERIEAAAIRWKGLTFSRPRPARHGDVIKSLHELHLADACHGEQGFVTSGGVFVDRTEALAIALRSGQLREDFRARGGELFSEDLW